MRHVFLVNHAAGLDTPHPEDLAQDDQQHGSHEHQRDQQQRGFPVRVDQQINAEERHAQKTADHGPKEAVSPVAAGILHVCSHAKDRSDTGKGGTAVQEVIRQRAQSGGQCSFQVAHPNRGKTVLAVELHIPFSCLRNC